MDAVAPKLVQAVRALRTGTAHTVDLHAPPMSMASRTTARFSKAGQIGVVLLVVAIALGTLVWRFTGSASGPGHSQADEAVSKSVAVLPFADMSAAKDSGVFC